MATKKKSGLYRLITTLLALAVIAYVGYQFYRSIFGAIKTELAVTHSVYESIDADGLVFRAETIIPPVSGGYPYYVVENGTRVAKDGVIAAIYRSANDGLLEEQMNDIDDRIAALKSVQSDTSGHISLDVVNTQIVEAINSLVADTADGKPEASADYKNRLLSLLSKKQIIMGNKVDFSDTISRLEREKKELKSRYHSATSKIKAPVSGYFADKSDGFEKMLAAVDPLKVTVADVESYCSMDTPEPIPSAGKVVNGYEWYLACVVSDNYYNALSVGTSLSVRMSFVTDDPIPVTVAACTKDNSGKMAVVFRCAYMSKALSTIRRETVQIQLVKHTGLRVPKRAIIITEDMQAGVYIRSGNVVAFRKIKQEYSEPADYVICEEINESDYLHLYDDIVVEGRGLYDGKIIR